MTERLVLGIHVSFLGGALSNCGPSPAMPTPVPTQSLFATRNCAFTDSTGSYVFPPGVWTEGRPDFPVRLWISS
jgi:hypothetical protein